MKISHALFATVLLMVTPSWAINKCTDVNGKVSYQDEECPPGKSEELKITDNASQADGSGYGYGGYGNSYGGSSSSGSGSGIVHTGPRGGRYTVGSSGNKNYISRGKR